MTAIDAQFHWMSAIIPNDQFLLYAFAGVPADLDAAINDVLDRACATPDLAMRVADTSALRYPRWVPQPHRPNAIRHHLADPSWAGCLDAVVALADHQLDARVSPWQLHVFAPVHDIPGHPGPATVVVLHMTHALADGGRASALAAWLFGRPAPVSPLEPPGHAVLPWRGYLAARAHRSRVADTQAGLLPPPVTDRPALAINTRPAGTRAIRTLVRQRGQLSGPTVTVAVLAAVSAALSKYLDEPCDTLGAEVPMAKTVVRQAHNHFGNVPVGLYPQLGHAQRCQQIATELATGRQRAGHRANAAADRAFAATPAALLRWGIGRLNTEQRRERVTGNTVVSSVHRGAADLHFGAAPVLLTAGFPALSPVMGLTHGVHGIGDTVVVSVHAAESALADIDRYLGLLDTAL